MGLNGALVVSAIYRMLTSGSWLAQLRDYNHTVRNVLKPSLRLAIGGPKYAHKDAMPNSTDEQSFAARRWITMAADVRAAERPSWSFLPSIIPMAMGRLIEPRPRPRVVITSMFGYDDGGGQAVTVSCVSTVKRRGLRMAPALTSGKVRKWD